MRFVVRFMAAAAVAKATIDCCAGVVGMDRRRRARRWVRVRGGRCGHAAQHLTATGCARSTSPPRARYPSSAASSGTLPSPATPVVLELPLAFFAHHSEGRVDLGVLCADVRRTAWIGARVEPELVAALDDCAAMHDRSR